MFANKIFCLKGLDTKKKSKLSKIITEHDGEISYFVSSKVTHLIVSKTNSSTPQINKNYNVQIVTEDFIFHSINSGAIVAEEFYKPRGQSINSSIFSSSSGRTIRVFISSTFKDMRKERAIIRKRIIHKLNQYCQERLLSFSFVDFSWGISDQMTQDGQVVLKCLQEVDRCLPYFISFLGERYGWHHPEFKTDNLLHKNQLQASKEFPWIDQYKDRSITELEIRAALKSQNNNAIIYLRSPAYDKHRNLGGSESNYAAQKLKQLKNELQSTLSESQIRNYKRTKDVYSMVEKDLKNLIDFHFPLASIPNPFHYEKILNERYSLQASIPYHEINYLLDNLKSYLTGWFHSPCLIYGESGTGKTCLLSAFYQKLICENLLSSDNLIYLTHYVRQSSKSTHYWLLSRIINEINEYCIINDVEKKKKRKFQYSSNNQSEESLQNSFDMKSNVDESASSIIENFVPALEKFSQFGKLFLFIDQIDVVDDIDQARNFNWIPNLLPHGIKMIFTASSPDILSLAKTNNWEIIYLTNSIDEIDKKYIIESHLKMYGKALNSDLIDKLIYNKNTNHIRYLSNIITELLHSGIHDNLEDILEKYLSATNSIELFEIILERLENYGNTSKNPNAIQDILSSIICSRDGLTETEILSITKIKRSSFISIFGSLKFLLEKHNEIYVIQCKEIEKAILNRISKQNSNLQTWKLKTRENICKYFEEIPEYPKRKIYELPWLFKKINEKEKLKKLLLQSEILIYFFNDEILKYEYINYWKFVFNTNDLSLESKIFDLFKINLSVDCENPMYSFWIGEFFYEITRYLNSVYFYDHCLDFHSKNNHFHYFNDSWKEFKYFFSDVADSKANSLKKTSAFRDAYDSSMMAIDLLDSGFKSIEFPSKNDIYHYKIKQIPLLTNLSSIFEKLNKLKRGESAALKALTIAKETVSSNDLLLAKAKNTLAIIYKKQKRFFEALPLYQDALKIRENSLGKFHVLTAQSLNNLGNISKRLDRFDNAEKFYFESLSIYKRIFGDIHADVAQELFNIGLLYHSYYRFSDCLPFLRDSYFILQNLALSENSSFENPYDVVPSFPLAKKIISLYVSVISRDQIIKSSYSVAFKNVQNVANAIGYTLSKKKEEIPYEINLLEPVEQVQQKPELAKKTY